MRRTASRATDRRSRSTLASSLGAADSADSIFVESRSTESSRSRIGPSITALTLLPIALLSGETLLPPSLHAWAVLLALALISHAGGQTLIAYALAQLPASFSSVALLLEPLVAAVIAWPLFGEHLGPVEIAGCVLVLAGIYISRRGSR